MKAFIIDRYGSGARLRAGEMEEAASIPLLGLTAWQALIEKAGLKKGQKVFIQAGSGGVGTFAIQLATHVGATVATTTSTANVNLVRSLGDRVLHHAHRLTLKGPTMRDPGTRRGGKAPS